MGSGRQALDKSFAIAANAQLDLNTVFSALDLDTDDRRKDRTNVLCVATVESGAAVISAVGIATWFDAVRCE